jgi:hypothetical protein
MILIFASSLAPGVNGTVIDGLQADKLVMVSALVGMQAQGQQAECPLGRLGVARRGQVVQFLDGLPVLRLLGSAAAGFLLGLQAFLAHGAFSSQSIGAFDVLAQRGDTTSDAIQLRTQFPLVVASGGSQPLAAGFRYGFPMPQRPRQRVRPVLLAAKIAQSSFARPAMRVAVAFDQIVIAGAARAAKGNECHAATDSTAIRRPQALQIPHPERDPSRSERGLGPPSDPLSVVSVGREVVACHRRWQRSGGYRHVLATPFTDTTNGTESFRGRSSASERTPQKTVLSGRMYMSCGQTEQPGGGLNLFLGDPGSQNRTDFLAQQLTTPRPPLVRMARAA